MTPDLRPYQSDLIDRVRAEFRANRRRVLMQLPTGGGKTFIFSFITKGAIERGNKVWILAHRVELVDQISGSLDAFQVPHGFIAAGYPPRRSAPVHVGSVQTLVRRLADAGDPDLIVVDEAHHCTAKNTIGRILAARPRARVLGVTATPHRLSGEGLGEVFESLVCGPSVVELIEAGALSPVTVYAPPGIDTSALHLRAGDFIVSEVASAADKPKITGDAITHYERHAKSAPFIVFCASVEHARHVAAQFTEAGYPTAHVDGGMDRYTRKRIINEYRTGRIKGLTSCDLVSEGFDVPGIHCAISLRPTASLVLWLQQLGRALRTAEGKDRAVILDHAGNTLRHGLPTDEREWSLEGRGDAGGKSAASGLAVRVCPQCFTANKSGRPVCSGCGFSFPVSARKVEEVDGTLQEVVASPRKKPALTPERREQGRAKEIQTLIELGRMRGYKSPERWAQHIIEGRQRKQRA